ncbi:MAG: RNase P subunit p30 family protein [Candidatus Helarchaeota archaeon]
MKIYADLHLHSNHTNGTDSPIDMIKIASRLGFSFICFGDFDNKSFKEIKLFKEKIREKNKTEVKVLTRIDIIGNDINSVKQRLRNIRPHVDIIGLKCRKKAIFNWGFQDSRVDLLTFFDYENFKILTYEAAKLANRNSKPIEIFIRPLIRNTGLNRSKLLRLIKKMTYNLIRANSPFIITSGAQNVYEMRAPRELATILSLVDLPKELCHKAVSEIPLKMIKNRGILLES